MNTDRIQARVSRAIAVTLQAGLLVTGLTLSTGIAQAQGGSGSKGAAPPNDTVLFPQGVAWQAYSFDQGMVELGKKLAPAISGDLGGTRQNDYDSSTTMWIERYKKYKRNG